MSSECCWFHVTIQRLLGQVHPWSVTHDLGQTKAPSAHPSGCVAKRDWQQSRQHGRLKLFQVRCGKSRHPPGSLRFRFWGGEWSCSNRDKEPDRPSGARCNRGKLTCNIPGAAQLLHHPSVGHCVTRNIPVGWYLTPFQRLGDGSTPPDLTHSKKEQAWPFQASKSRMGITYRPPFAQVLHYSRDTSPENLKL